MDGPITLTGADLSCEALRSIARDGVPVTIGSDAAARIAASSELVLAAARSSRPVYGVTTGLGSQVTEPVADGGVEFALRTIRGRATAVGAPLSTELVRAALATVADDRALGPDVDRLAAALLADGSFVARVAEAAGAAPTR